MVDIEHMAALCMKDLDEEDGDEDGDLESDADLLVTSRPSAALICLSFTGADLAWG